MILIFAEHAAEVVPFVLFDPQLRNVVGVASVPKIAEKEVIKERAAVIERVHLRAEVQQARPLLQVNEGVVSLVIPGNIREAVTEFDGLLDVVVALVDALLLVHLLSERRGTAEKRQKHS